MDTDINGLPKGEVINLREAIHECPAGVTMAPKLIIDNRLLEGAVQSLEDAFNSIECVLEGGPMNSNTLNGAERLALVLLLTLREYKGYKKPGNVSGGISISP